MPSSYDHLQTLTVAPLPEDPRVTVVTLNRPSKRNAIDARMWREIGEIFRTLGTHDDDDCRCVLLRGAGKAFCAGIDVTDPSFFAPMNDDDDDDDNVDVARRALSFAPKIREMQSHLSALEDVCPVPVVAAVHGACVGAGVDLVCCADVRLCADDAVLSVREARLGLAADVGTLQRLPKIVGHGSRVRELCLTGEDFDGREAARIGLVSRAVPRDALRTEAVRVCRAIARNSPVAVATTKRSLVRSRDASVADGLEDVATRNAVALMTRDMMLAATSRRGEAPEFAPLLPHARL